MYQVTVRGPDGSEASYDLGDDQGLIIGRDEGADIVLPSKRVSRRHARLFSSGETLQIEDLGSQNGVFVGGARVNGTAEFRAGPPIEIGEFKIRVKRLDKADPRALQAVDLELESLVEGRLDGLGTCAGQSLVLPKERGFVGRDKTCELSIDNDSVSRKHAEIRAEAGLVYVVRDLSSSNGTFVNGTRLKPGLDARLKPGDKVRFGETHWQYQPSAHAPKGSDRSARQKKLIAAMAVLVVIFGVALVLKKQAQPSGGGDAQVPAEELAAEAVARGQQSLESDHFDDARQAFEEALEADPVNSDARVMLRKAEREIELEKIFKEASQKAAVGRDQDALGLFFKIDPDSRFFARARLKVQEIGQGLMRKDSADCREAGRKHQGAKALEACARYLDFKCHTGEDKDALKILRDAEHGKKDAWSCPLKLAPWFGAASQTTADPSKDIAQRYDDPQLRDAVLAYVRGDVDDAQRQLGKVKNPKSQPVAEQLREDLVLVDGRYKEGQAAVLKGNLRDAQAAFEVALASDGRLVPPTVESSYGKEMRSMLARALFDAGKSAYDKSDYAVAYDAWAKGIAFSHNDPHLLDGLARLEKVAEGKLAAAPGCDELNDILRITRDNPPSPSHEKAAAKIAQNCE